MNIDKPSDAELRRTKTAFDALMRCLEIAVFPPVDGHIWHVRLDGRYGCGDTPLAAIESAINATQNRSETA